ncbi:MAG: carotenoid 1,2-hydratase [Gammaproteobacteria bacterium]|nr:carotenoid 1,2-hydratase [Gammaproteobacteria bacterium]
MKCVNGLAGGLVLVIILAGCDPFKQNKNQKVPFFTQVFGAGAIWNFQQAYRPHKFSFPEDYAAHPGFRHEWWHFSGNVDTTTGQRFGYELTIFRVALSAQTEGKAASAASFQIAENTSDWRSDHSYIAHFTLTDIANETFYYSERISRDAMGLAGAGVYFKEQQDNDSINLRVWLADWGVESVGDEIFPLRLFAKDKTFSIDLVLQNEKPVVLQGNAGLWQKGKMPGNAAYYYSITRISTVGIVGVGTKTYSVAGDSWFDREWSTTQLDEGQPSRDWFRLQLSDKREIMFYASRQGDNSIGEYSIGSIVAANGESQTLSPDQVEIRVIRHWNSPHSNIAYPSAWKISIPSESLVLQVTSMIADQELNLSSQAWRGAVKVSGKQKSTGSIITGYGHVELAGYAPDR